jgi:serine O-acetyltransferase
MMKTFWRQLINDAMQLASSNAADTRLRTAVTSDGFQLLVLQRLRERARRYHVPLVNHLLRRVTTVVYGLELGNGVTVGDGVSFVHPMAVVVGGESKVGNRVRFMGSNTVGTAKENGWPVIEDDVLVGAGARILGPIRIGQGAVIGANAVVLTDVPAGAVVTGIPGVVKAAKPRRVN